MPIIRTRTEIDTLLGGPTPAERRLLAACEAGEICVVGDGELPPEDTDPTREIRADVLRYLILGGCENCRVQGQGVCVAGAHITGRLDLSYQIARGTTDLMSCRFENGIEARRAKLADLHLDRSHVQTLNAERAEVTGDVFLNGIFSIGEIKLFSAIIGGQLACNDARFSNEGGVALNAEGATVGAGVFLRDAEITGEVNLAGSTIGGQLSCEGANLSNESGLALNAQSATIREGLIWQRETACQSGTLILTSAKITDIVDNLSCWPNDGRMRLHGLTYKRIHGNLDVAARLLWLKSGSYNKEGAFTPQPYTQLAKVYRTMGRGGDARRVLCARERLEHRDLRRRKRVTPDGSVSVGFLSLWRDLCHPARLLWSLILRATIGYGFAPYRALWWLGGIWLLATLLAHLAWTDGDFAPNSDVLQTSAAWLAVADGPNPAETWSTTAPGRDWETFNAIAYAADLVIPIIDLNQTDTWTPSTNRGLWGQRLWRYGFLLNLAGWIITALGAAALTGIVQKERD